VSTVRAILIIISLSFFIIASIPIQVFLNFTNTKYKRKFPLFFYKSVKAIIGLHIIKKDLDTSQEGYASHGILYVANHVSWFDIICLGSILNARFIAKKEVASMGIFGLLSTLSNTIYIDNENKNRIVEYNKLINEKLKNGENFIIFPEGTTSDGNGLIQFKSSLLQCAIEDTNSIKVRPISICYSHKNNIKMGLYERRFVSWVGDTNMVQAMQNFLLTGPVTVTILLHSFASEEILSSRKTIAKYCQETILEGLNKVIKI